jgi:hypothetical protein
MTKKSLLESKLFEIKRNVIYKANDKHIHSKRD